MTASYLPSTAPHQGHGDHKKYLQTRNRWERRLQLTVLASVSTMVRSFRAGY